MFLRRLSRQSVVEEKSNNTMTKYSKNSSQDSRSVYNNDQAVSNSVNQRTEDHRPWLKNFLGAASKTLIPPSNSIQNVPNRRKSTINLLDCDSSRNNLFSSRRRSASDIVSNLLANNPLTSKRTSCSSRVSKRTSRASKISSCSSASTGVYDEPDCFPPASETIIVFYDEDSQITDQSVHVLKPPQPDLSRLKSDVPQLENWNNPKLLSQDVKRSNVNKIIQSETLWLQLKQELRQEKVVSHLSFNRVLDKFIEEKMYETSDNKDEDSLEDSLEDEHKKDNNASRNIAPSRIRRFSTNVFQLFHGNESNDSPVLERLYNTPEQDQTTISHHNHGDFPAQNPRIRCSTISCPETLYYQAEKDQDSIIHPDSHSRELKHSASMKSLMSYESCSAVVTALKRVTWERGSSPESERRISGNASA